MKLISQNNRIIGTATDDYAGVDNCITAPMDFDIERISDYVILDGVISIPPAGIPQVVTMRQARLALLSAGLLSDIISSINALPSPQKEAAGIEWEYSQTVERHRGFVLLLSEALGLTITQLDDLFILANTL